VLYGFVPLETGIARDSRFLGLSRRCRESGFRSRKFGSFHVAYYAMLSFVSSPGSIAEIQENWFFAETCPSLIAAKRHASQWESPLHSHIFLLNGP
jgi:hypothetical protein